MSALAFQEYVTDWHGSAGFFTLSLTMTPTDPSVLFACIFQDSNAGITPPAGWTVISGVTGTTAAVYVKTWVTGDPTSYNFFTGDAAIGMMVAINHCDTDHVNGNSTPNGAVNPDTSVVDTTRIYVGSVPQPFTSPTRPYALVAFGISQDQTGAFSAFSGGPLIGEFTHGRLTIVAGYILDIPADGVATPTQYFSGANSATGFQSGLQQIVALDADSVRGGFTVGAVRIG